MQPFILEQVIQYQAKTIGAFATKEEALRAGEAAAKEQVGVLVCAELELDADGNPTGKRRVFRVW